MGYSRNDFKARTTPLHRLRREIETILAEGQGSDHLVGYLIDLKQVTPLTVFARSREGKVPNFCQLDSNASVIGVELMAFDRLRETLPNLLGNIHLALRSRSSSPDLKIQEAAWRGLDILTEITSPPALVPSHKAA